MSDAEYVIELPCPFCGGSDVFYGTNSPTAPAVVRVCNTCRATAPLDTWNSPRFSPTLEQQKVWHYPAHNLDVDNLPAPGEIVVVYYRKGDEVIGPTLMSPVHQDGPPTVAGLSIYQPVVRWCAIPAE